MTTAIPSSIDRRSLLRGTIVVAGAAVVLPSMGALSGCASAPGLPAEKMDFIAALADRIMPATDTPGAIAAKVPDYIAAVFEQHFTPDQQSAFLDGLDELETLARSQGSAAFTRLDSAAQDTVLENLTMGASDAPGRAIFQQVRDLTLFGFYTSEVATQELAYEELPGRYDGCVPLDEVGSAWLERGV